MAHPRSDFGQPIPGYEVLELIGSGGAGSVYRARQTSLGRMVALKVIRRDRAGKRTTLERIAKEARLLARLDHPNIVRSIDFGQAGELMFFTMEFVDGQSAKQLLQARGALPLADVLKIGADVAHALDHAAHHGVTHRDVKPGNILLARDGAVKLSDFGLARAELDRSLTRDGTTVGTPQYMAPEQVKYARRADLRSDLYSLGASLYHLATGQPPFEGESVAEVLHEVLYARPWPPEQLRPELPASFSRVLARAMARNPARRYQSGAELIADLQRVRAALERRDDGAAEVGLSWQDAAEPPRVLARRTAWGLGAAALVALGVTLGLVLTGERGPAEPAARRAQEEAILTELQGEIDRGARTPVDGLAAVHAFRRDGTLTAVSGIPRQRLEESLRARIDAALQQAAERSVAEVRGLVGAAQLTRANDTLPVEFDAAADAALGNAVPDAESLGGFDYAAARESALLGAQQELNRLEQSLLQAVQSGLERAKRALLERLVGGPGQDGMLGRGQFPRALACIESGATELQEAMRSSFVAAARDAGLAPPPELTYSELQAAFPEAFRRERESDPFLSTLEAEWRDAVRAEQVRLVDAIDQLEARHLARIEEGEFERTVSDWSGMLESELAAQGFVLDELPADPVEWQPRFEQYRAAVQDRRARVTADFRRDRLDTLLHGRDGAPGVLALLEAHDVPGAQAWLGSFDDHHVEAEAAAWRAPVAELARWWTAVDRELAARQGQTVSLRDDRGRLHAGPLSYHGPGQAFEVGPRVELTLAQLDLEALQELAGVEEVSSLTQAVLLVFWGRDAAAMEQAVRALEPTNPVAVALTERLAAAHAESAEASRAANEEVEELVARARQAQEDGRYQQALETLRSLRTSGRLRRTARYRELRSELEEWERELRHAGESDRLGDALRPLYRNAADFAVLADGRVRVVYDFADARQGEDFDLGGGGVLVANQAMRIESEPGSGRFRVWGPSLPLAVDRRHPFQLSVKVYSPFEQAEPPQFVLMQAGGICVGLYAPRGVRLALAPQLAVWEGSLDEFDRHFYDPVMASEPEKGRVVRNVGLDRALAQDLEIRYDPEAEKAIQVLLDGKLIDTMAATRMAREPRRWEIRTPDALQVQRLEFTGVLRSQ